MAAQGVCSSAMLPGVASTGCGGLHLDDRMPHGNDSDGDSIDSQLTTQEAADLARRQYLANPTGALLGGRALCRSKCMQCI